MQGAYIRIQEHAPLQLHSLVQLQLHSLVQLKIVRCALNGILEYTYFNVNLFLSPYLIVSRLFSRFLLPYTITVSTTLLMWWVYKKDAFRNSHIKNSKRLSRRTYNSNSTDSTATNVSYFTGFILFI